MTYITELRRELAAHGIRGRLARRIELEFADHLACAPDAVLGSPAEIASRFAAELRVVQTRRGTIAAFASLALAALVLLVPQRGISAAGGWPDVVGARATIASLAGLTVLLAGQVSFVAGVLGAWLLLRRSGELRLIQRRMRLAIGAGGLVLAGQVLQAFALQPALPTWWFVVALTSVAAPVTGLGASAVVLRGASLLTPPVAPATRAWPWQFVGGVTAAAVAFMCVGSAYAEHSWAEGLTRGGFEAAAIGVCYAAFGRYLGIRRRLFES
jgi:hypothetical protein